MIFLSLSLPHSLLIFIKHFFIWLQRNLPLSLVFILLYFKCEFWFDSSNYSSFILTQLLTMLKFSDVLFKNFRVFLHLFQKYFYGLKYDLKELIFVVLDWWKGIIAHEFLVEGELLQVFLWIEKSFNLVINNWLIFFVLRWATIPLCCGLLRLVMLIAKIHDHIRHCSYCWRILQVTTKLNCH